MGNLSTASGPTDTTGTKRYKPTDTTGINWGKKKQFEADILFEDLQDLTNPQFRAWYCKMFFKLGRERVLILASQARADAKKDSRKLFSYLLKKTAAGAA